MPRNRNRKIRRFFKSQSRRLRCEPLESRRMLDGKADIVFFVDESFSSTEASTQEWLRALVTGDLNGNDVLDAGEEGLAAKLAAVGIADLQYGLVGFGERLNTTTQRFSHSQLFVDGDPDSLFGDPDTLSLTALNDVFGTTPDGNLVQRGGLEDGWDGIEHAIAEYDIRDGAVPVFVLLQNDEGRVQFNNTLTRPGVLSALESKNVILNSFVVGDTDPDTFMFDPVLSADWFPAFDVASFTGRVLGVEADEADNVADGLHLYYGYDAGMATGTFDPQTDTLAGSTTGYVSSNPQTGRTETNDSYVRLAWDTGGTHATCSKCIYTIAA